MTAPAPGADANLLIGEAARLSGISARMLRHYEQLGLLGDVRRSDAGYRRYSLAEVHTLRFIKRARDLGFSMEQVAELVGLWRNRRRTSASVKRVAQAHLDELEQRIAEMQAMQRTLAHLVHCCHGDQRPDCPILDDLSRLPAGSSAAP
ncbi:Cu(I)-responsive transcriptional regulator [Variovorax sp.]|uniref:Cu(I)-responsive transcriptional regulator n=1 Tax=Variovorax sp. TaxID=1871043 RepID=UPI002D5AA25B|nr:Cu(I)-responsive transcriptional regulator [Variovorax sp.]HYP82455.1 Cu(I)-responsive transcriptional regulator [Variovorax sp.]